MSAEPPIVIADEPQKRNITEYFIIAPKVRTLYLVQDARDQNRHYDLFGYAIHYLSVSLFLSSIRMYVDAASYTV